MAKKLHLPSLQPLRSRNVLVLSSVIALLYYLLEVYLFNRQLINQTLSGDYPLTYQLTLLVQLIFGYFSMFPFLQILFVLVSTILVGINTTLLIALMQRMKQSGKLKMSFGGFGVFALVSAGCPGCGLTILSFLGPSSGMVAGVIHNPISQVLTLVLLSASTIYSLRQLEQSLTCRL